MKNETPVEYLVSKLNEQVESVTSHLSRGGVANIEEYRRLTGVIQGLNTAIDLIKDLAKQLEENDE